MILLGEKTKRLERLSLFVPPLAIEGIVVPQLRPVNLAPLGKMIPNNPTSAGATIAHVQDTGTVTSHVTTVSATLTIAGSGAGNFLAMCFVNTVAAGTVASVTDSASQTWTNANVENGAGVGDCEIWYFANTVSGVTTVTITIASGAVAASSLDYNVSEWSGVKTTSPLDAHPAGTTGSSVTMSSPALAQAVGNELSLVALASNAASLSGGMGGGFTALNWTHANGNIGGYLIATDAASHTATQGIGTNTTWCGTGANFEHA